MKKIILLFVSLVSVCVANAQAPITEDNWQEVATTSVTANNTRFQLYGSIYSNDVIYSFGDSSYNMGGKSFISAYNVTTRANTWLTYPPLNQDRLLQCAAEYKTGTPGESYVFFGGYANPDIQSYPLIYKYNTLTGLMVIDSVFYGNATDHDGVQSMCVFSPSGANDSLRIFARLNNAQTPDMYVFTKHISDAQVLPTIYPLGMDNVKSSIVYKNKLYIAGDSLFGSFPILKSSVDGINYTNVIDYNNFINLKSVVSLDTLNGELYFALASINGGFSIYKYDEVNTTLVFNSTMNDYFTSFNHHKNKLWFSTKRGMPSKGVSNMDTRPSVWYIENGAIVLSKDSIGSTDNDGPSFALASSADSMYLIGNYFDPNLSSDFIRNYKLMSPVADFSYNNNIVCANQSFTLTANCQNTDSVHWKVDGAYYATSPGSSASYSFSFPTAGNHTVGLVAFGGTLKDSLFVNFTIDDVSSSSVASTNVLCNGSADGTATVTPLGGTSPYNYTWSNGAPDAATTSSLSPGTYSVIVSDVHACSTSLNFIITEPSALNINLSQVNPTCYGSSDGALTATAFGGTAPYTYSWTTSTSTTSTAPNLPAGTYTCLVMDANGCSVLQSTTLVEPQLVSATTISVTNITCNGLTNGAISLAGFTGGTITAFNWMPGNLNTQNISGLNVGNYTCTMINSSGCVGTVTATVSEPTTLIATISQTNISCFGANNGKAQVVVTGGTPLYTYNWNASSNSDLATGLITGVHTCTITDVNNCSITQTVLINQPTQLSATTSQTNVTCFGGNDAIATVTASGGVGGYTYNWTNFAVTYSTTIDFNVTAGTYTANVTDANNCAAATVVTILDGYQLLLGVSTGGSFCETAVQTLSVSATNGVAPFTYAWTQLPATTVAITASYDYTNNPTDSHDFVATMTDANGCSKTSNTITVNVNASKNITGSVLTATTNAAVAGYVTLYKFESFYTKFDSLDTTPLDAAGNYTFNTLPLGDYILKATPSSNTLQVTYSPQSINWQTATVLNHQCNTNSIENITVIPLDLGAAGTGTLSGHITAGPGYGQRLMFNPNGVTGLPIKGAIVKGGRNPGVTNMRQTTTDSTGKYTLTGLPNSAAGETYYIVVDIPGLDTNGTYYPKITNINNLYENLDFIVDSAKISPVSDVSVKEMDKEAYALSVYPNPAQQTLTIALQLKVASAMHIQLFDVLGNQVKTILPKNNFNADDYRFNTDLTELANGIYFIKLNINDRTINLRLIKSN